MKEEMIQEEADNPRGRHQPATSRVNPRRPTKHPIGLPIVKYEGKLL